MRGYFPQVEGFARHEYMSYLTLKYLVSLTNTTTE